MIGKDVRQKTKEALKDAVDSYVLAFDPCDMCKYESKVTTEILERCLKCAYYYASQFESKITGEKK